MAPTTPHAAERGGSRLREVRERSGKSQRQLASPMHVTVSTVKHWESGRTSFARHIEKLGSVLGVSPGTLLKPRGDPIRWLKMVALLAAGLGVCLFFCPVPDCPMPWHAHHHH